jgi:hypothetical protein
MSSNADANISAGPRSVIDHERLADVFAKPRAVVPRYQI